MEQVAGTLQNGFLHGCRAGIPKTKVSVSCLQICRYGEYAGKIKLYKITYFRA
jgi:hypothetical protein